MFGSEGVLLGQTALPKRQRWFSYFYTFRQLSYSSLSLAAYSDSRFSREVNGMGAWHGNGFALIVVLFILLIIVGAAFGGYVY